jgi:hypothetical protein
MAREAAAKARLRGLHRRVQLWRTSRAKLGPMPAPLWAEAAVLAGTLGVSHVATVLGLGYESLKQRTAVPAGAAARPTDFVEMTGAQLLGGAISPGGPVIDLVEPDGARLTITLPAGSQIDLAVLVAALRQRP